MGGGNKGKEREERLIDSIEMEVEHQGGRVLFISLQTLGTLFTHHVKRPNYTLCFDQILLINVSFHSNRKARAPLPSPSSSFRKPQKGDWIQLAFVLCVRESFSFLLLATK
jgi:hypothetical protein